jgi:hypothetical protein
MQFDYEKYPDGISEPLKFLDHEERVWDRGYYCEVKNGCWYELYVKDSINRIEAVFGPMKYKFAKGTDSCQILRRIKETAPIADAGAGGNGPESEIDCLLMIDREIDLVSPFCVNQTYEGLLDEFFRIKTCSVTVDTNIITPDAQKDPKIKVDPV